MALGMRLGWFGSAVALLLGCSQPSSPDGRLLDAGAGDRAGSSELLVDVSAAEGPVADRTGPPGDGLSGGLVPMRYLSHLHSAYSHDGCDGKGLVGGKADPKCLQELRAAVCAAGLQAALLTDHPSFMSSHSMTEDLLHDAAAGDQLLPGAAQPWANRISCPGGGSALLLVGFETSAHSTPLGLEALPSTPDLYQGFDDATDPALAQQRVQGLAALGAVTSVVHSEAAELSAKTIVDSGVEAMEWYNIHANFKSLIGPDTLSFDVKNLPALAALIGKLSELGAFMTPGPSSPHPDLAYLIFLDTAPLQGIEKWQKVQAARPVTGLLGSDIHQNVSVDPSLCAGVAALGCQAALGLVEGLLGKPIPAPIKEVLLKGGPLLLSDGQRVDGYARLMRWLENRALVEQPGAAELKEAIRRGRSYGVFSVLGDPQGFSFTGTQAATTLQMGDAAAGPVTLRVQVPKGPVAMGVGGVSFTASEAASARLRTRLLRLEAGGAVLLEENTTSGALIQRTVSQPGAYAVEIWIRPGHLLGALGSAKGLADKEYLWVLGNPIRVKP